MSPKKPIRSIVDYAELLTKPLRVLVLDPDPAVFSSIVNAMSMFDTDIERGCGLHNFMESEVKGDHYDIVFVGVPLGKCGDPETVVRAATEKWPNTSVVIMAESASSDEAKRLLEIGPFTFLKKSGSLNAGHVQSIARQLNIKLRPCGRAEADIEIPATETLVTT